MRGFVGDHFIRKMKGRTLWWKKFMNHFCYRWEDVLRAATNWRIIMEKQ